MTLLYALILLGILIFVHELGHFIFAKSLGVKVLKFSLGFGPKVVGRTFGETEYVISAIPLGGYVKMLGEEPGEELDEAERQRAFGFQRLWKRFVIVFAGPFFNIAFAFFLLFLLLFFLGEPALYPDAGKIADGSPAMKAGLMTGDRVEEIDGRPVQDWDDIENALEKGGGKTLLLKVKRNGKTVDLSATPERKTVQNILGESKEVWDLGVSPLVYPEVGQVMKASPAEKAGIKKGDRILEINGAAVKTWQDMSEKIHDNSGKPLRFLVQRGDHQMELTITPVQETIETPTGESKKIGVIGIRPTDYYYMRKVGLTRSVTLGAERTWRFTVLTVMSVVKLIERVIPASTIGGPILIFQAAGQQASRGALDFFTFMAVISINLGVLNVLPIPILDGGHLMFIIVEAVRKKPVSEKVIMTAQRVGLAILVTLMVFALYNDILRLISGKTLP